MTIHRRVLTAAASLIILLTTLLAPAETPLGTTFTYQGRLTDVGAPATGTYDFQFILFDAAASGTQVGPIQMRDNVVVTGGLFTVFLDFGSTAFAGNARWLETSVRPGASTGSYTPLSPLQELTTTPYALFALTAANANLLGGLASGNSAGRIPINNGTVNTNLNAELLGGLVPGNASGSIPVSNGMVNANLNADLLDGLNPGNASGNIPVSNGTLNSNLNADLLDGLDSPTFQRRYSKVAIVAQNGTNDNAVAFYSNPATAMTNSATWCGSASASNPCLLKIMPGIYTVSSGLQMQAFIDIEGSGRAVTKITRAGSSTILGENAEIRHLTIENTGGGTVGCFGILTVTGATDAPNLQDVEVDLSGSVACSGACSVSGIHDLGNAVPELRNVRINVQTALSSATIATLSGIYHQPTSSGVPLFRDLDIDVSGTATATTASLRGVALGGSGGAILERVRVSVSSSNADFQGVNVLASGGVLELRDSVITATRTAAGAGTIAGITLASTPAGSVISNADITATATVGTPTLIGINVTSSSGILSVSHSRITALSNTIASSAGSTIRVGASMLAGGPTTGAGTRTCAGVYDESFVFSASACP